MSNGGCSHKCVNIAGGFKCECPDPELSMLSDNKTCHGKYKRRNLKKKKNSSLGYHHVVCNGKTKHTS